MCGSRRDPPSSRVCTWLDRQLATPLLTALALKALGIVSLKPTEPGLRQLAHRCPVPFATFSAEALREHGHRFPASSFVRETVGVGSVSGPVAWLLSQGNLSGETLREQGVTITLGVTH
ncbi:cobalamin biosynthesis protein CbiG [Klebsiella pneumoniae]|nr:cobalamin biosynthesis protein CbiG [Klebsiella pneumoniae]